MRVRQLLLGIFLAMPAALPLAAQVPVLSSIQGPYPAVQSSQLIHIAGGTYGSGAVSYGPHGTPLVLSGSDFGPSGTVLFPGAAKGSTVAATVTNWSPTILFVTVPGSATTGLVSIVTNEAKTSNALPFIVTKGTYAGSCPAIAPSSQLEITTSSLPNGTANQSYSVTLNATGGNKPYTWSVTGGTLPSGLSLNASTGVIAGTPTSATGIINLNVQAVDSSSTRLAADAVLGLSIDSPTLRPTTVYSYSASYDHVGNVISYTDQVMGNWTFTYDDLNRLGSGTPSTGPYAAQKQYLCFDYDSFGNRTQSDFQTTACKPGTDPSTAKYNANNQVTFTTVNAQAGGLTYDPSGSGNVMYDGANWYSYDGEGRICAVQSQPYNGGLVAYAYIYDAEGRRVGKGTITPSQLGQQPSCNMSSNNFKLTESYVLGQSGEQLTTLTWSNGTSTWQSTNVYGEGKLLATYDAAVNPAYTSGGQAPAQIAALHFQLTDPLGTRRVQTNAIAEAELDCQSLPFGDQQTCFPDPNAPNDDADEDATGAQTPIHFTNKQHDTESGNDYFGARYLSSSIGSFLSPDFQDMSDDDTPEAIPNGDVSNPQTLNLYSYTQNNPLSRRDYDGHASWQPCADGSGGQCWTGDYNGEQNNGLFWNSQSKQWQGSDPNPPPSDDPAGIFFTGLTRTMLGQPYGLKQMAVGMGTAFVRGGGNPVGMALASAVPAFIPKGWIQKPSNKGTGTKYVDPNNPHNSVRLEPAKPGSSNPGQQRDYMVVTKNGQTLDANGNPVPRQSLESHIPQGTELPPDTFEPIP